MSQIDDAITIYLAALAVEGKRPRTIESYDETLRAFRRAGRELALPDAIEDYSVEHAYGFLGDLQSRGASAAKADSQRIASSSGSSVSNFIYAPAP